MRNWFKAAGMSAAMALCAGTAAAQETTAAESGEALGACMVEHYTKDHENQFKLMIIDALNDDTAALNKSALAMGMGAIMLATQSCALSMTDLQSPKFEKAAEVYGEAVASKLLNTAMAKIGVH